MLDSQVGDYYVSESGLIGRGSFSKVYLAESTEGKKAAIKMVKKSPKVKDHVLIAKSEARILNTLKSPSICELLGTFQSHNHYFLIENYYEGENLSKIISKRKRMSCAEAQKIFRKVLQALQYLIQRQVMHRDIKPENIICNQGNVVLIDFGFACEFQKDDPKKMLQTAGTPAYMSPQILGKKYYNSKSDIWSLGVVLFQMLYGYLPYTGRNQKQLLHHILKKKIKYDDKVAVPASLKHILQKCLQVDIRERISWKELFFWNKIQTQLLNLQIEQKSVCCSLW